MKHWKIIHRVYPCNTDNDQMIYCVKCCHVVTPTLSSKYVSLFDIE